MPYIIEKQKALSEKARRQCIEYNILYNQLPDNAKIFYIKNSEILYEKVVLENCNKVSFIAEKPMESKKQLLDVMFRVENLHKEFFILDDIYKYCDFLKKQHSENNYI